MTCREIENNLPAYLEDLLPPEEKDRIREHLVSCRQCSKALADLQQMDALLSDLEEVTPPPWLKQRIMARVREETQPGKGFFRKFFSSLSLKIPLSTAALLLISVLAFYVYRGQEPELQKEGIQIALPPPVMEQRTERQALQKTAPDRTTSSRDASSETVYSRPTASSRPVLPQELPPARENSLMKPPPTGSAQPADQGVPAHKDALSLSSAEIAGQEKGKCPVGKANSAEPRDEMLARAPFPLKEKNGAAALRETEKTAGCAPSQPAPFSARAEIRSGSKAERRENKADPAFKMAEAQERDRTMPVAEIISLLRQFDAVKIDRRTSGDHEILTADLPSRQVQPLLQKLETRGLSRKNISVRAADAQQETVSIRIEIPPKP